MILINKAEAKAVREQVPGACVYRTMKQRSKRGHFWLSEGLKEISLIARMRSCTVEDLIGNYYKNVE